MGREIQCVTFKHATLGSLRLNRQRVRGNPVIAMGLVVTAALVLAAPVQGQVLLPPKVAAAANRLFELSLQANELKCSIQHRRPHLDYTFHFVEGFLITCPVLQFGGQRTRVSILTRVTPDGGTPVVLGTYAIFRRSALKLSLMRHGEGKVYFRVSGGFSVGVGRYYVEVLVADSHNRICRRRWWIKVPRRWQRKIPVVLATHHVSPLQIPPWHGVQAKGGLRLAVLLSATSFSPYAPRLRAWNQISLLQILSALLQQTPCSSVRLVAFNLDQERVIFRTRSFKPSGFAKLRRTFQRLDLGIVSVHTLEKRNDWAQMLAGLANRQLTAQPPPDAVVILGRSFRWMHKVPEQLLKPHPTGRPEFFYFESGPNNLFPDALGHLTKSLGGKIYRINTPDDLGKAIHKMLVQLSLPGGDPAHRGGSVEHRESMMR